MFSSSTTTPSSPPTAEQPARVSRRRSLITYALLGLWCLLIAFGIVSQFDPVWLRELAEPGKNIELTDVTNFGDDAFRRGDLRQAIGQYTHALKIDPNNVRVRVNLGISLVQAGIAAEGERILRETLAMTDSPVSRGLIYYALGSVHEARNESEQAIECYRQAAETGTEIDKRYGKLGTLYLAGERLEPALDAFSRALAAKLDISKSYREMLYLTADSDLDSMQIAEIERQIRTPPSETEMAQHYDLEIIRKVQADREVAVTHNYLGWTLVRLERFDEAATHFEQSLRIWPGNRNAAENLNVIRQIQADRLRSAGAAAHAF